MKLTVILSFCFCLQVAAHVEAQSVTLSAKSAGLEEVLLNIKQQTGLNLVYNERFLRMAKPVTIAASNEQVEKVLDAIFADQPFTYAIQNGTIVLKERPAPEVVQTPAVLPSIDVRGKVVDEKGIALAGATVMVKGGKKQTQTNNLGEFVLTDVDEKAVLVITYIGYTTKEVNAAARVTASLTRVTSDLDEVVTVAYGNTTARTNTGSVVVIKGEQIQNLPNRSFDKSLQGLVPGLYITQGSGQPGGGVGNFTLRGIATGASPNNGFTARQPLVVIDGVPVFQDVINNSSSTIIPPDFNPLAQISPSDIESISVLKDAAAIALYGSKASNGVILVTTKKGKEGKTTIGFRHVSEFAERLGDNQKMLNQQQYLELLYETYRNTDPNYTDAMILADLKTKFPTRADGSFYPQADWLNAVYRDPAVSGVNELSISGGNARQTFYLGIDYSKQNGIDRASGYDRKSLRFNYDSRPASWLKVGFNTMFSYNEQHFGSGDISERSIARMSPLNPIHDERGELIYLYQWGGASASDINNNSAYFTNPVAHQQLNLNRHRAYRSLTTVKGEARFLKYFTIATQVGLDFMFTDTKRRIHPKISQGSGSSPNTGSISGNFNQVNNLINTNTLRFEKSWHNEHNLSILAGHEAQVKTINSLGLTMSNIASNPMTEELLTGTPSGSGLGIKQTLLSYFGQVGYGFRNRYFLNGSIRTDGSSLFGENNRFGSHWSIGAGYDLSSESFMRSALPWISFLKLRGSFGSAGNSAGIIHTLRYNRLSLTDFINEPALVPESSTPPNSEIRWEKTFIWNLGLDLRMLKERIQLTAELYTRNTSDLLGTVPIAAGTGYRTLTKNIGNMRNTGLELALTVTPVRTQNFQWTLSVNWSGNKNKYTSFANAIEDISGSNTVNSGSIMANGPGKAYNSFYLVQWAGVDPATGKPLWIDSLGKLTSDYSAARPVFSGRSQPKGFGAASQRIAWKNLSFSMIFTYQYGSNIYADAGANPSLNDGIEPFLNQSVAALDRWQKPGDIAKNPRRLLFGRIGATSDNATQPSTRYQLNGDFIRLSNMSLNYQFPKSLLTPIHLSSAGLFVAINNVAMWTRYTGKEDPESASALGRIGTTYPLQRTYSIGVNLNF